MKEGCGKRERLTPRLDAVCIGHLDGHCQFKELHATDVPGHSEHPIVERYRYGAGIIEDLCSCDSRFRRPALSADHEGHPILSIHPRAKDFHVTCTCGCEYDIERIYK